MANENKEKEVKEATTPEVVTAAATPSKEEKNEKNSKVAEVQKSGEKEVAVLAVEDHSCNIGGKPYQFRKNKEYKIPATVATILSNAKKVIKK